MAAMTTALTAVSEFGDVRTYTVDGVHTFAKQAKVVSRRKEPAANASDPVVENSVGVYYGTVDADGAPISPRFSVNVVSRRPVEGASADSTATLALVREIVASDEFGAMWTTANHLK